MRPFDVTKTLKKRSTKLSSGVFLLNELNWAGAWVIRCLYKKLPLEVWGEIFKYNVFSAENHQYVTVIQIKSEAHDSLLFRRISLPAIKLHEQDDVEAYEEFLADWHVRQDEAVRAEQTYRVSSSLTNSWDRMTSVIQTKDIHRNQLVILCTSVHVPDIISYVLEGDCYVCRGDRSICPGCTGGKAQSFDAAMGCGDDLACPLCLGYDFCQEDRAVLLEYYASRMPKSVNLKRRERWNQRLQELGYPKISWERDDDSEDEDFQEGDGVDEG